MPRRNGNTRRPTRTQTRRRHRALAKFNARRRSTPRKSERGAR
jgi:hypothetical protein